MRCVIASGGTLETALLPGRLLFLRADFGLELGVALSAGARQFVTLTAMRAVSGRDVYHDGEQLDANGTPLHLSWSQAELLLVYPASARILAECATGSVTCPVTRLVAFTPFDRVVVAPAVHEQMDPRPYCEHVARLTELGCTVIGGTDLHADWASVKRCLVARLALEPVAAEGDVVRLDELARRLNR